MALYDEDLKEKIHKLPMKPGVYQYLDSAGKIIYVGKAKKLRNRVLSYLNKTQTGKTSVLVRKVCDLKYIVVDSEQDALLLENNLIKQFKPKYNILLKDDKTYPWICIVKEPFPRVFLTRRFIRNGSDYFGPYTSVRFANSLMYLIRSLYRLRTCRLPLNTKNISAKKFKVCLEFHIGNCLAPCVGNISDVEYDEFILQIQNILKGNISSVLEHLNIKMNEFAVQLKFEKANEIKIAIEELRKYQSKSMIVTSSLNDIDVFSYIEDEQYAYVNYLKIVQGSVNQVYTLEIEKKVEEGKEGILAFAIYEIRLLMNSHSKEIIVPFNPEIELSDIQYVVPKIGDKIQLLELSERNAAYFKLEREHQRNLKRGEDTRFNILKTIKNELKLPILPHRMECFDNSNTQGTNPVASCVVFIDAKPAKKEYRKFHVKTVEGPDDFASMEEIIYRRYKRVLEEGKELPDLIVIDGGKGQLHSALNSLQKLNLHGKITIIGLAKRMEEIYYPGDKDPYLLAKNSLALKTLMHIRDEAHRFGITFHRQLREKPLTKSILNDIKGIGRKTEEQLIQHFKSVGNIRKASLTELTAVIGVFKARIVKDFFDNLLLKEKVDY